MAESKGFNSNQQSHINQILIEAQHRWLRPNEICDLLHNYQRFTLTTDPPNRPPSGSLILYDRKVVRHFRKDGLCWRKKRDGTTVQEAHEKLKAGGVDVLHCYYAHGEEDNEKLQRRCYSMLDAKLEHIVLVHYREVEGGGRSSTPVNDPVAQTGNAQTSSAQAADRPAHTFGASYASSPSSTDQYRQTLSEYEEVDSGNDPGTSSRAESITSSRFQNASLLANDTEGFSGLSRNHLGAGFVGASCHDASLSTWSQIHRDKLEVGEDGVFPDIHLQQLVGDSQRLVQEHRYFTSDRHPLSGEDNMLQFPQEMHPHSQNNSMSNMHVNANDQSSGFRRTTLEGNSYNGELGELKKLDSFGRWMDKELGRDCDDSLMASDSVNYWNTLDTQNDDKEVSSLSHHMQLDIDSVGPSLSQDQLFSIHDFSPDWAYSGVETKVLITGRFLGESKHLSSIRWSCMFGEVEVPADVLTKNVLRCQAPPIHASRQVPFYITCSNRLACSEVREFEYREKKLLEDASSSMAFKSDPGDEVRLQIRLAKMLHLGSDKTWLDCFVEGCDKCTIKNGLFSRRSNSEKEWGQIEKACNAFERSHGNLTDALIQKCLKDKLYEWLVCKIHEDGIGPQVLDDEGQGVIHLAAALGYEWAMDPIVFAGVSPSFRDAYGRTGLHWAAYFGREETVVALVRLGSTPGAVEVGTSKSPGGQTAADLASSRGHKRIAEFLDQQMM